MKSEQLKEGKMEKEFFSNYEQLVKEIETILRRHSKSGNLKDVIELIEKVLNTIQRTIQKEYILVLPELLPDSHFEHPPFTIKLEEAEDLLTSKSYFVDLKPSERDFCLLSIPGFVCYLLNNLSSLDETPLDLKKYSDILQEISLLSLKIMIFMLKEMRIPLGIFITTPECEPETGEWEEIKAVSTVFYLENGLTLYIIEGDLIRIFPKSVLVIREDKLTHALMHLTNAFPFPPKSLELFQVIDSPLSRKIPPKKVSYPNIQMTKVGMKQLKASFVMLEDLREGDRVEDEDEKKLIWNSLIKKSPFSSPAIHKNDILIPIKRKNNFNVAFVCEETPEPNIEVFVTKPDVAIVRLNPKAFSNRELENFVKLLIAEVRSFPQKGFSIKKTLNINILRNIIGELIFDEIFRELLKETDLEKLMSEGRKIIRKKFAKYLGTSSPKA